MATLVGVFNMSHSPFCYMPAERWNDVRAARSLGLAASGQHGREDGGRHDLLLHKHPREMLLSCRRWAANPRSLKTPQKPKG